MALHCDGKITARHTWRASTKSNKAIKNNLIMLLFNANCANYTILTNRKKNRPDGLASERFMISGVNSSTPSGRMCETASCYRLM